VVTLTVPDIKGLKMPAAKPIASIVNAIPVKDFVTINKSIVGRYARYEMIRTFLKPYLSANVPEKIGVAYENKRNKL
jgi:hypothetical protein